MQQQTRRHTGEKAEKTACKFLKSHGLKLITKNYSCRYGEIDLLMRDKDQLVCVEVRYRSSASYCHPLETISNHKRRCLIKTASDYILRHEPNASIRFDVVGIDEKQNPDWIQHAFLVE